MTDDSDPDQAQCCVGPDLGPSFSSRQQKSLALLSRQGVINHNNIFIF